MSKEESSGDAGQEGAASGGDAARKNTGPDIYEAPGSKRIVRLFTVMAYMFSVSFVAIVLSGYYLFLWEPPNPRLLRRPVHLSAEPEAQFLISDGPIASVDHARQGTKESSSGSRPLLASRMAIGDRDSDKSQSLFLFRNSLVELLRNRSANGSRSPVRDAARNSWNISEPADLSKVSVSTEISGKKASASSTGIMDRPVVSSPTPDSPTISGVEARSDRLTNIARNFLSDLAERERDSRHLYNRMGNAGTRDDQDLARRNFQAKERTLGKGNLRTGMGQKARDRMDRRGIEDESLNGAETATNVGPAAAIAVNGDGRFGLDGNSEDRAAGIENIKQVFDLNGLPFTDTSASVESVNRPIYPPRPYQPSSSLTNGAPAFEETQTGMKTTRQVAVVTEQGPSTEITTTQRQIDLLTILTKIVEASTSASTPLSKATD